MSLEELLSMPILHLVSGLDMDGSSSLSSCGKITSICGYTEWISQHEPPVSIGWDWCIHATIDGPLWTRVSLPRSNILLLDETGDDTHWQKNLDLLATVADALPWREHIPLAMAERYA